MHRFLSILLLIASCLPALGQTGQPIKQSGNATPGHPLYFVTNGIAGDAGTAVNGFLTSVGVTASGDAICQNSAGPTSAGWQRICLGVTTAAGADITVQHFGTATAQPLTLNLNGTAYQFPFALPGTGIIGPGTTVIGDFAEWANTIGTLLQDVTPTAAFDQVCATNNNAFIRLSGTWGCNPARISLSAGVKLYVNPSSTIAANCNGSTCQPGSDSNSCLTIAAPCLTPQHAGNILQLNYDLMLQQPVVQLSDNNITGATYTCSTFSANLVGGVQGGTASANQIHFQGNTSTPTNVQLQGCSGNSVFSLVAVTYPMSFTDMQIGASTSGAATNGHGIAADFGSRAYYSNIVWGFMGSGYSHAIATYGSFIEQEGFETVSGNAAVHWYATYGSTILMKAFQITCTGTPAFSSAFVAIQNNSNFALNGSSFSGCSGVTGTKFIQDNTSTFGSGTADPNTLYPGNANGTVVTPSNYLSGLMLAKGGSGTGANNPVAAIAAGTAGNIPVDSGSIWATVPMSGDCTLAGSGAITCTQINGVPFSYTSGSWTPAIATSGTAGTPTYTAHVGSYEQIGRQVTVRFSLILSGWSGSPSGNITITGLPVTAANVANDAGRCFISFIAVSSGGGWFSGEITPNSSVIILYSNSSTASTAATATQMGTTPTLDGYCSYRAS